MKQSVSRRGVLTSGAALPLAAIPVATMVPVWPMLPVMDAAAISGQLPANKEAATKVLNAVFDITEAVCDLDSIERQKALGIFGELLLTVETGDDLDEVYGLLDRLLQDRRNEDSAYAAVTRVFRRARAKRLQKLADGRRK